MAEYIVDVNYQTDAGNFGYARYILPALDEEDAFEKAVCRVKADKRRRCLGKFEMSASPWVPAPE